MHSYHELFEASSVEGRPVNRDCVAIVEKALQAMLQSFGHPKGLEDVNDSCNNRGHKSFCNNLSTKAYAFGHPKDCRISMIPATTKDI